MSRNSENQTVGEVVGLMLLGIGTLLFLALISYNPKDVPEWFPIISHNAPANHPAQNFIGPIGAIVAGIAYFLLGAASYLIAAVMLGYGGAKLLVPDLRLSKRSLWVVAFVLSGACLADLQASFLNDWQGMMKIPGKGG